MCSDSVTCHGNTSTQPSIGSSSSVAIGSRLGRRLYDVDVSGLCGLNLGHVATCYMEWGFQLSGGQRLCIRNSDVSDLSLAFDMCYSLVDALMGMPFGSAVCFELDDYDYLMFVDSP